jgi:hypothetical protein
MTPQRQLSEIINSADTGATERKMLGTAMSARDEIFHLTTRGYKKVRNLLGQRDP